LRYDKFRQNALSFLKDLNNNPNYNFWKFIWNL
jgi:hypothetical protein